MSINFTNTGVLFGTIRKTITHQKHGSKIRKHAAKNYQLWQLINTLLMIFAAQKTTTGKCLDPTSFIIYG
jgi:hypothetical protein